LFFPIKFEGIFFWRWIVRKLLFPKFFSFKKWRKFIWEDFWIFFFSPFLRKKLYRLGFFKSKLPNLPLEFQTLSDVCSKKFNIPFKKHDVLFYGDGLFNPRIFFITTQSLSNIEPEKCAI